MKKNITIFVALLFFFSAKAKEATDTLPYKQYIGTTQTLLIPRAIEAPDSGNVVVNYADTTTANFGQIKNYNGASIFTTTNPGLWLRNNSLKKWYNIPLGQAPSPGDTTGYFWTVGYKYFPVIQALFPPKIGTASNDNFTIGTNATDRLILQNSGLAALSASTDSILVRSSANVVGLIAKNFVSVVAPFNNSSTSNGLDISGANIALHSADATNPGAISTGVQTIAGAKTFTSNLTVNGSYAGYVADAIAGTYGNISFKNASGTYGIINAYAGLSYFSPAAYPYHSFNADGGAGQQEIVNISNNLGSHIMAVSGRILVATSQNGGLNAGAITINSTIAESPNPGTNHRAINDISIFRNPGAAYAFADDNGTIGNDTIKQLHHASFEVRLTKDKAAGLNEIRAFQVGQINAYGGLIDSIYGLITYEIDTLNSGIASNFWAIYDQYRTKASNNYGAYFGNAVGIGRYQSHPDSLFTVGDGGAWFKQGVRISALPAFTDTTNYKPVVVNASGTLYKATYWPGGGLPQTRVTSQFDKTTNTTLSNITGLTATLVAGHTYRFEATLFVNKDAVGGEKYTMSGTCTATAIIYEVLAVNNAGNLNTIAATATALNTANGQASGTSGYTKIAGTITVNAAGTLVPQFAQNSSSGTSSVLVGSTFVVTEIL